ncbi:putative ribonuclease H-like domain-containing protein [Tanacetum coccineum]
MHFDPKIAKVDLLDDEDDVSEVQTVSPVKTNETQTVKTRVDKIGQTSQKQGIGFKKIKACFVCKSTDHLIKDCNFHDKQSQEPKLKTMVNTGPRVDKPVWDNTKRVNHQKISKYPHLRKTFVPSGVLTRTGLITPVKQNEKRAVHTVSTARPVSTVRPFASKIAQTSGAIRPIYPRMDNVRPRGSYSPIKRSYYTKPAFRPKDLKQDVKTFGVQNMTTAGTRAVVNTGKGKMDTDLKKSRWVWRPKGNYLDHVSKDSGSFMLKKGNPEILLQDHAVVDSGCSSHMTGNKAYLSDYEDYNGGFVAFGSDPKGGKITGKGKIKTANLDFDDVYFVDELKFNLFSVSQMCDKKNSVLFTESECLILSPSFKLLDESQVVLRAPRKDDVYSLDLKNIVPSGGITCLYANAIADESKLWHRRLGHVNFKNINKLVKGHLVRGLPSKVFVNDHTCVACKKGKQHKASCKAKLERIIIKPLELLHMGLFGPVFVESINKKSVKEPCRHELCAKKGIKREFSVARTPQQNGVAERKNRTLIEAARTMLAESLLPILFWAEEVNTACYVLNRVLVTKPQNKTPYELLIVSVENQVNVDAGTQDSYVAGSSGKDKEPTQEYILLLLHPHRTRIPVEDVAPAAHEKPSESSPKDNDVQDLEDVADKEGQHQMTEDEQVLHDELEKMIAQEVVAKALDDATRQAFEEEKRNVASQKRAAQATSINKLSTVRSSVSTATTPYVSAASYPQRCSNAFSNDGIFIGAYDVAIVGVHLMIKMLGVPYVSCFKQEERFKMILQHNKHWIEGIRLFLAFASYMGFTVYQMDVKSAFLYGTIEEEVYVHQPPGFVDPAYPNKVYKVIKALYGLHQAPRACLDKYVADILKKFDFWSIRTATTPIESNKPLVKDEDGEDVDVHVHVYRSMIGSLMYLTASRPYIMFTVHSDYRGVSLDRKSTTGSCQFLGRRLYLGNARSILLWQILLPRQNMLQLLTVVGKYYGYKIR